MPPNERLLLGVLEGKLSVSEPPNAPGGYWYYLSPQWHAIVWGLLDVLDRDKFWDNPEQARIWLVEAMAAARCDECRDEPVPTPEPETKILYSWEDCENELCECEAFDMACNCGSAANVRFCDGKLEYRNTDGSWSAIPIIADNVAPSLPPDGELPEPTSAVACAKAHALFDIIDNYFEALIRSAPEQIKSPLGAFIDLTIGNNVYIWYARFKDDEAALPANTWDFAKTVTFWTFINADETDTAWDGIKSSARSAFLCEWQDMLSKEARLSDGELSKFRAYEFATGNEDLDKMLNKIISIIVPTNYIRETVSLYAKNTGFVCDCVGSEPQPEVPEGYGRIEVQLVDSIYPPNAPQQFPTPAALALTAGNGVKISETAYETEIYPDGDNKVLGLLITMPAGARITNAKWSVIWTGATSGRTWWVGLYPATEEDEDFTVYYEANAQPPAQLTPGIDVENPGFAGTHHLWITYGTIGTVAGDDTKIAISNLRFDIAADDGSWTRLNVAPMVLFQL